jgi:hypothetical protein
LPFNNSAQETALHRIIAFVKQQKDTNCGVTGYTYSEGFKGGWWSDDRQKWIKDRLVILMIDYMVDLDDDDNSLLDHISMLRRIIVRNYSSRGIKEDEFWIVSESLTRYF